MARRKKPTEAARPVPLTAEQVASLTTGQGDQATLGRLLAAHDQPRLPAPARKRATATAAPEPIPVSAAELRELSGGTTPTAVATRLGESAARRRSGGRARPAGPKPTRRPA